MVIVFTCQATGRHQMGVNSGVQWDSYITIHHIPIINHRTSTVNHYTHSSHISENNPGSVVNTC
jgi:hypothetical protein